ncbi:general substrate transporter [Lipomyces starkeyi]
MIQLEGRALLVTVTTITSLGFFLIGFDNGLMGGFVNSPQFLNTFGNPGATMIGVFVAIYEVGAFIGSVISSLVGESLGRRKTIATGSVIMIIGAVLQASSYSRVQLIIARVVSGIGMGFINSTTPVLQAEYSPKASRGIFVCMQISTLNFGIMMVYWIDFGMSNIASSASWRIPTILQCVFLILQLILLCFIPDTSRWYASHDRPDDALMVLQRLLRNKESEESILALHEDILQTVAVETSLKAGTWKDIFKSDTIQSRRRFLLACGIQIMQQLSGINAVIYYANTLFESSVGFSPHMAGLMSGYLNTWFFVASFIPYFLIDRFGRRPLLMSMISLMAAAMVVQTALIYQVQNNTSSAQQAGAGAAAMLFVFLGAFSVGFQSTVWVYPSEILPLRFRQRGSSISTASNWIFNYMVVQITPPSIQNIGWKTYIIWTVFNACWVPIIYFFYPETKGLQLEDVDRLFAKTENLATLTLEGSEKRMEAEAEHKEVGAA